MSATHALEEVYCGAFAYKCFWAIAHVGIHSYHRCTSRCILFRQGSVAYFKLIVIKMSE